MIKDYARVRWTITDIDEVRNTIDALVAEDHAEVISVTYFSGYTEDGMTEVAANVLDRHTVDLLLQAFLLDEDCVTEF
jgi:hypothetical protein